MERRSNLRPIAALGTALALLAAWSSLPRSSRVTCKRSVDEHTLMDSLCFLFYELTRLSLQAGQARSSGGALLPAGAGLPWLSLLTLQAGRARRTRHPMDTVLTLQRRYVNWVIK